MVIDEASPRGLVHFGVYLAIHLAEEEAFENVEADEKVEDEDDADDEGAERSERRD